MADRVVDEMVEVVPELPQVLEDVLLFAIEEAKEKLAQSGEIVPFTCLVVKNNLFIESHPADSVEDCYAAAQHTVQNARGASAYAFCYDGYVETDEGEKDCIIAEGGLPGEDEAHAVGCLYEVTGAEGNVAFEEEVAYIGDAPNFMIALKNADEYTDEEVEELFPADEAVEEN